MEEQKHNPSYIPQIGIPEKESFRERNYTRAIYHRATAPGFFGVIILCFFMSFINIKCGGRVVDSYSGIDIITASDHSAGNKNGATMVGVRQSAYNQFEKSKAHFKWEKELKENYDEYAGDPPVLENDFSAIDDFYKMPRSFNDTTSDPTVTRSLASIAFIAACVGLVLSALKKKFGTTSQIILGLIGFIAMLLMQMYVKITLPESTSSQVLANEYSTPMVTTEFALGYWLAFFLFLTTAIIGFLKLKWNKKMLLKE